jgi:hypothetical protein
MRRFSGAFVIVAAVAVLAGAAAAQDIGFTEKLPVGGKPVDVSISNKGVTGASNGIGDLIVLSNSPTTLTVFDGTSKGPASPRVDPILTLTGATSFTTFPDAGSGRDDVAVAGVNAIAIGVSDGSGGFTFHNLVINGTPNDIVSGDFNNDGFPDLAWIDVQSNDAAVSLNNGSNFFSAPRAIAIQQSATGDLMVGNANTDATPDVFVATSSGIVILEGVGDGSFGPPISFNLGQEPASLDTVDLDLDGLSDVVVGETGKIQVLHDTTKPGAATVTFSGVALTAGTGPVGVATGDISGDGIPDILGLSRGSGTLSTFVGLKSFGFTAEPAVSAGVPVSGVTVGRLNDDPFQDVAAIESNGVAIFDGTGEKSGSAGPGGLPFLSTPSARGSTGHKETPPETIAPPRCPSAVGASCSGKYFWDVNVPLTKKPIACGIFNVKTNRAIKSPLFPGYTQKQSCAATNRTRVVHGERKRIVHVELTFAAPRTRPGGSATVRVEVFWKG